MGSNPSPKKKQKTFVAIHVVTIEIIPQKEILSYRGVTKLIFFKKQTMSTIKKQEKTIFNTYITENWHGQRQSY